jgi:hypothetical protein
MSNLYTPKARKHADLGAGLHANLSVFDDGATLELWTEAAAPWSQVVPAFRLSLTTAHVAALRKLLAQKG